MNKLDEVQIKFGVVKKVGADGERLAHEVKEMIRHMDFVINEFESGLQSETWTTNFEMFGGQEAVEFGMAVYQEIKESREKLQALGI